MDGSCAGPSGVKKRKTVKKIQKPIRKNYPLTEEELMQCLMDSDDDVKDPDYSESDGEDDEYSDDEEIMDISGYTDYNTSIDLDVTRASTPSPFRPETPAQPPVQMPPAQVQPPQAPVMWDSVEYVPTNIPFTKQSELLIQPSGKF